MSPAEDNERCEAIAGRVAAVRDRIDAAARRAGRDPAEVALVAVSKRKPAHDVVAAVRGGVQRVAENYVQEAREKIPAAMALLRDEGIPAPCWHLIGRLQRNKAKEAVEIFDVVESADREPLLRELSRRAAQADCHVTVLLQVSLCGEAQKGGAAPEALPSLLAASRALPFLRAVGLMTIPPLGADPEASRLVFARLRALREELRSAPGGEHLEELSMGMSADFEVAVEEGATLVRVGTALFGPREETR